MRPRLTMTLVLAALLAGCGDGAGTLTTTTATPTSTTNEAQAATTTEAQATTTTLGTTTLAAGTVSFSGTGAFASPPFSLPGPSSRYIVETTAGRVGTAFSCMMVVRIEKGGPFGATDVYWFLTYTYEDGPSTETDTRELTDVSPSEQFRLVTEPEEGSDCSWTVTLRPA